MRTEPAGAAQVLTTSVSLLVVAGVLGAVGWYGLRHAHELVHPTLDEESRWRRERSLRRGGALCLLVAAVLPPLLAVALVVR